MNGQRVAVIGCGHVGLVTAAFLAARGHCVAGIDADASRVTVMASGRAPFWEPGLDQLVARNIAAGRLLFTSSFEEGLRDAAVVFLCVDTPARSTGAADLSKIRMAAQSAAAVLAHSHARPIIVNKSTAPIGTAETVQSIVARAFAAGGSRPPHVVANPEFLREGHAVEDMFAPSRIVLGAERPEDASIVASLYAGIEAPVLVVGLRAAEMIKYVSNAFLATRLSFINEVARLCEGLAIDADDVIAGAAMDPRVGGAFFQPGIGHGGSCLPKDVAALAHTGDSVAVSMRVLAAVQEVNTAQRKHAVNCIRQMLGSLEGRVVAAWGITFKGGTEDTRESPALDVIALLRNEGASVRVYDPSLAGAGHSAIADDTCGSPLDAAAGADAVAVLTDWDEFRAVDLIALRSEMRGDAFYDGRNLFDRRGVEAAGFRYHGVGRPLHAPAISDVAEVAG